jgi:23S rRNA (cytidine1920-2'-O)/16S rRNA (cytidine1409-2'-O)-methyltransferase
MSRIRADLLLVRKGLAESRQQARRLIEAGSVRTGADAVSRPAALLAEDASLSVLAPEPYVSRGGQKLEAALTGFAVNVAGLACLDLGASTGGFSDCLLQRGAASVLAVDVGHGQLHATLRADTRVMSLEGVNARELPQLPPVDFFVADLSFISLAKVLPAVAGRLPPHTPGIVLLKPQFEAGPGSVPRDGVITDPAVHERVRVNFVEWARMNGWPVAGIVKSPITGGDGNVEFLVHLQTPGWLSS